MNNNQKGFNAPLLIAIIALMAIGGGVYVYESSSTKTYANAKYGFEFKYPSTWKECDREYIYNLQRNDEYPNYNYIVCIFNPLFKDLNDIGLQTPSITFFVDESGQYGILGNLRKKLQDVHDLVTKQGVFSTFAEKNLGGRTYLHAGSGHGGSGVWGRYYTLLDAKTAQKTYLIIKYSNTRAELENILSSSLKFKEDALNF